MMIAWKNLRRKLSAFGADQRGNIALTFLLVALPVIAFVGAAVDYSRANSVKASMQAALDATALMLSKEASTDTDTQRKDNALKYFSKLFDPPQVTGAKLDASNIQVKVTYDTTDSSEILIECLGAAAGRVREDARLRHLHGEGHIHRKVGHHASARGARARQHRLDGRQRQDAAPCRPQPIIFSPSSRML